MPANIESMAFSGQVPWHRLGTRLDNPATAREAITAAGLAWEVQKQPLYTGPERNVRVIDRYVVCRTDRLEQSDGGQLGVVGSDYEPLQNHEAFSFLDPVVGENAANYHTMGSLRGGRQIWLLAKLPGEIRVTSQDVTEKYILLSNSHDGTSAVRIGLTPIRVVCQNTLNLALRGMGGVTIRHHAEVASRVKEAHRLIGIVNKAYDTVGLTMQGMVKIPMTGEKPYEYFRAVLPLPEEKEDIVHDRVKEKQKRLAELFETGIGNSLPEVRGSLWAAYNAVTQWVDRESYTARNKEPLKSIWFGEGAGIKQRAFDNAKELISAL
jgi:phage/plasmid-like protein (TIGR03299 family)